jgi:hypothetical protein
VVTCSLLDLVTVLQAPLQVETYHLPLEQWCKAPLSVQQRQRTRRQFTYVSGIISSAGNITYCRDCQYPRPVISKRQAYLYGNGSGLTGLGALGVGFISSGTSNVIIVAADGNVNIGVGGTANVAVFTTSTSLFCIGNVSTIGIEKIGSNAVGNIGSTLTVTFNRVFATSNHSTCTLTLQNVLRQMNT